MVRKYVVVGLLVLLAAAVGTFVGVFFSKDTRSPSTGQAFSRAAVAADAGPCSEIGRSELPQYTHVYIYDNQNQIKMYLYSPFYTQACHRGLHIRP